MFIRAVQHNTALDAFRAEVSEFCEREMPPEVRRKQARGQHLERHEYDVWLKRLGSRGWLTGKWPKEHGGLGWQPEQFLAFQEELGRAGAPPSFFQCRRPPDDPSARAEGSISTAHQERDLVGAKATGAGRRLGPRRQDARVMTNHYV
jgi:hypothetical protein